ncbi:hypothetical protein D3C76_1767920 [compost metagenome]
MGNDKDALIRITLAQLFHKFEGSPPDVILLLLAQVQHVPIFTPKGLPLLRGQALDLAEGPLH